METAIQKLLAEREALRNRLEKIEAAISDYERWAKDVVNLIGGGAKVLPSTIDVDSSTQTPMSIFEAEVRDLLARVSTPLKRTEVHDELTKAGIIVGGKEPLNTVASRLSRMKGVVNLKGHGYWAEERPYAPAGHQANDPTAISLFEDADPKPSGDMEQISHDTTSDVVREGARDAE